MRLTMSHIINLLGGFLHGVCLRLQILVSKGLNRSDHISKWLGRGRRSQSLSGPGENRLLVLSLHTLPKKEEDQRTKKKGNDAEGLLDRTEV